MYLTQNRLYGKILGMEITDSKALGFLQILLAHEKDIVELKACNLALSRALIAVCGDAIVPPLQDQYETARLTANSDASKKAVEALELLIAELLPTTGSKN